MPRLPSHPADSTLELEGESLPARAGESVAAAMIAAGESLFARSIKYHRPRGAFCMAGACSQCLVRINGVPNLFACRTPCAPGMRVERQNSFPSAKLDLFAVTDWFFPRGLNHHEMFAGVPVAQTVMAKVARQLAGLGTLPDRAQPPREAAQVLRAKHAIVGAGMAGLAAARVLRGAGREVLLLEREAQVGGRARLGALPAPAPEPFDGARTRCEVVGFFDDEGGRFIAAVEAGRLLKVYFEQLLLAPGGTPQLLVFENNDLPGIYAGSAVAALLRRDGVLVGERVAVVGEATEAAALAALLEAAGARALAVGARPLQAHGLNHVSALTVEEQGERRKVDCDAVALCASASPSFELARQAGARVRYDDAAGLFVVEADAHGRTPRADLFVAGQITGPLGPAASAEAGARAAKAMLEGSAP